MRNFFHVKQEYEQELEIIKYLEIQSDMIMIFYTDWIFQGCNLSENIKMKIITKRPVESTIFF